MNIFHRTLPFFLQHDASDCGPAVLRMVAGYYGLAPGISGLREMLGPDREGVSLAGLADAARKLGFEAMPVWLGFDAEGEAPGLIEAPLPCILHWEQRHFVVLYKLGRKKAWIADPAKGKERIAVDALKRSWLGEGEKGAALLLLPGEAPGAAGLPAAGPGESLTAFVWKRLRYYRKPLGLLFAGAMLGSLMAMLAPFLAQAVVDIGIPNRDLPFIALLLTGQLLLAMGQLSMQWWQNWLLMQLGSRLQVNLLSGFIRKLTALPQAFFDRRQTGDLLQRIDDHQRIEQWFSGDLVRIAYFGLFALVFGAVLLVYSPLLFAVFLTFSLGYVVWAMAFLRERNMLDHRRFGQSAEHQEILLEMIQGMPDVKLNRSAGRHYGKWGRVQLELFRNNLRALYVRQMQDGGAGVINQVKDLLLIFLAAWGVARGDMTLGMFVAVQFIIGQLNVPVSQLVPFIRSFQDARISLERVQAVLQERTETGEENRRPDLDGAVELQDVSFRYRASGPLVLEQINLSFPPGKKVAIVGPSGSGKSTLLRLLLGLYEPEEGTIRVGNEQLSPGVLDEWRARCGAALQDGFLFSDTIAWNIAESEEAPDMNRVREAAEKACIHEFIQTLPHAYETYIGPKGMQLSQGQQQRLLLARAWYRSPRFWVLDEATGALEAPVEDAVWENLCQQRPLPAIVFSSHNLRTVQRADWVVVLENGVVVEMGGHEELMGKGGVYFRLFHS